MQENKPMKPDQNLNDLNREELITLIKEIIINQKKLVNVQGLIIDRIKEIYKGLKISSFILGLIIWRVFLWEPFNLFFKYLIDGWGNLSEGYRILILGIIGTLFAGIIANIVGGLVLDKIKKILNDKDDLSPPSKDLQSK